MSIHASSAPSTEMFPLDGTAEVAETRHVHTPRQWCEPPLPCAFFREEP